MSDLQNQRAHLPLTGSFPIFSTFLAKILVQKQGQMSQNPPEFPERPINRCKKHAILEFSPRLLATHTPRQGSETEAPRSLAPTPIGLDQTGPKPLEQDHYLFNSIISIYLIEYSPQIPSKYITTCCIANENVRKSMDQSNTVVTPFRAHWS